MHQHLGETLASKKARIHALVRSYAFNRPMDQMRQLSQRLDEASRTIGRLLSFQFQMTQRRMDGLGERLASVNPERVLKRGYAIVARNGTIISSAKLLHPGDDITVGFHDGRAPAEVQ